MRLEALGAKSSTPPRSSGIDDSWVERVYCSCRSGGASGLRSLLDTWVLIAFGPLAWAVIAGGRDEVRFAGFCSVASVRWGDMFSGRGRLRT